MESLVLQFFQKKRLDWIRPIGAMVRGRDEVDVAWKAVSFIF
jgi:hypothetical protein